MAMLETLTLKLPAGASVESGKALEAEIKRINGIKCNAVHQMLGLNEAAITFEVGLANFVMDVVKTIIDVIRREGVNGVEIQLPNHSGTIRVDSRSHPISNTR